MHVAQQNEEFLHVVFENSNYQSWLFRRLKPGFQHCYIIKASSCKNHWIKIETSVSSLNVELFNTVIYPSISDIIQENATVLACIKRFSSKTSSQLGILSCVDITKRILGINDFWCFTPYQLYKKIIGGQYGQVSCKRSETWREGIKRGSKRTERFTS